MPYIQLSRRARRASLLASLTLVSAMVSAVPAMADDDGLVASTTTASQQECMAPVLSQPFSDLKDNRHYVLAPGGDFSNPNGGGWQFFGGAHVANDTTPDGNSGGTLECPAAPPLSAR